MSGKDPPDPSGPGSSGLTTRTQTNRTTDGDSTCEMRPGRSGYGRNERTFENITYDFRDTAPYRVYFELRNKTNDEKINKFTLGATLTEIDNMKQFITDMKYVGKHKIIVFLNNYAKANLLVQLINDGNTKYRAYVPKHLVCISGVISGVETELDVDYLKRNIECEVPVVDIRRMTRFVAGTGKIPIARICVTFRSHELPKTVRLMCCMGNVQPFTPKVVVCLNCLRFGHRTENCRGTKRCGKCAERHEEAALYANCPNFTKCVHCKSTEHTSDYEKCPERKRQHDIRTLMAKKSVTFTEAREQIGVLSQNTYEPLQNIEEFPTPAESYASMTQGQFKWKNPLREQWIQANQERKAIKAAVKTYPEKPKDKQKQGERKRMRSDQETEAEKTTQQRNVIIGSAPRENNNGVALMNPHKVIDKQVLENLVKEAVRENSLAVRESMISFYAEFMEKIGQEDDLDFNKKNTIQLFKKCTEKHFSLAKSIMSTSNEEEFPAMEINLPEEVDTNL